MSDQEQFPPPSGIRPSRGVADRIALKHVAAVVAGNALEFYDFISFAIFAVFIGKAFFPGHDPSLALLQSLAVFGVGFVTRPVGAIVLGTLGDRIGRKPAMVLSFALMGAGMLGVALTPTYAQIGLAAPVLLVLFRLVQGFALGGEVGPTTAYLVEAAPDHRRGLYGSMQYASQSLAMMLAAALGALLAVLLPASALEQWGWRIAFLAGVLIVPFGLMLRKNLPETLHAVDDAVMGADGASATRAKVRLRPYLRLLVAAFLILVTGTIGTYVLNYTATFAMTALHLPPSVAFGVALVGALAAMIGAPLGGWLSDRYGRRPVMLIPFAVLTVAILPAFWLIVHYPDVRVLYAAAAVLAALFALYCGPTIIALTESLPPSIRSGTVAMTYAVAITIFGGATQFFVTWLIRVTGSPLAPAVYWTVAAVVGLVAVAMMPESAPVRITSRRAGPA